jgi:hypothetical protein
LRHFAAAASGSYGDSETILNPRRLIWGKQTFVVQGLENALEPLIFTAPVLTSHPQPEPNLRGRVFGMVHDVKKFAMYTTVAALRVNTQLASEGCTAEQK